MRLLTRRKQIAVGKRLAAIYYIAIYGFGHDVRGDMDSIGKIVEHIHDIAMITGGERMARIEVPALVYQLRQMTDKEEDEHDQ
ncbi:MAG: hypothetical protein E7423_01880 [Ruminococcaceae bacterium]|jgi:hypothetical protein|nr:hypothetical protein [Oscillospiraceae bacterium]